MLAKVELVEHAAQRVDMPIAMLVEVGQGVERVRFNLVARHLCLLYCEERQAEHKQDYSLTGLMMAHGEPIRGQSKANALPTCARSAPDQGQTCPP